MPDLLELELTIPPGLGLPADVRAEIGARVQAIEAERAAVRQRTGGRVLGRRAVLAQPWNGHPTSVAPRRNLRPTVASPNKWARAEALMRNRIFLVDYVSARDRRLDGIAAHFPPGTYWLRRFASVPILAAYLQTANACSHAARESLRLVAAWHRRAGPRRCRSGRRRDRGIALFFADHHRMASHVARHGMATAAAVPLAQGHPPLRVAPRPSIRR